MQLHEQGLDGDKVKFRENWLRQKRFAIILSGDDRAADLLVERLSLMEGRASNPDMSSSAYEYFQLKKLYELWVSEVKSHSAVAPLFQSGRENEAIQKGLDPSIAKIMGRLPSLHRAVLLLIYGEKFSYAATAQLLDISIEELMGVLAGTQQQFFVSNSHSQAARSGSMSEHQGGASYDPAQ